MLVNKVKRLNPDKKQFYVDTRLYNELMEWRNAVLNHDFDMFIIIFGKPGSGKSSLAMQVASVWNSNKDFNVKKNVHWDRKTIMKEAMGKDTKKGDVFILDESYGSAASINRGKSDTEDLIDFMNVVRKRNLCFIFLIPELYDLAKYYAFDRAKMWIRCHVKNKINRGDAHFYFERDIERINRERWRDYRVYPKHIGHRMSFNDGSGYLDGKEYGRRVHEYLENKYREKMEEDEKELKTSKICCDFCGFGGVYKTKLGLKCKKCGEITPSGGV